MRRIISVENLSKRYEIGAIRTQGGSLRESVSEFFKGQFRGIKSNGHTGGSRTIWALKDINFEVGQGELIGIIGRNGAGKSTLLKILSRITEPTTGRAEAYGRIGSLLEVGTGFHPELSGRENIYLNGSILGMKRMEIDRKFDEIVAFAEIEKFLDTPVKYYSSGMYMRLAFSVAAHLESDILLVDEVLAVGDADFQKRCLGKMHDVAKQGRTVVLVSHNMLSISRLCKRSIWIDDGRVAMIGPSEDVISKYLLRKSPSRGQYENDNLPEVGRTKILIKSVRTKNNYGEISATIDARRPFSVEIDYEVFQPISFLWLGFTLTTISGVDVLAASDGDIDHNVTTLRQPGRYTSVCQIPGNLFNAGSYVMSAYAAKTAMDSSAEIFVFLEQVLTLEIDHPGGIGSFMPNHRVGVVSPKLDWEINPTSLEEMAAPGLSNGDH